MLQLLRCLRHYRQRQRHHTTLNTVEDVTLEYLRIRERNHAEVSIDRLVIPSIILISLVNIVLARAEPYAGVVCSISLGAVIIGNVLLHNILTNDSKPQFLRDTLDAYEPLHAEDFRRLQRVLHEDGELATDDVLAWVGRERRRLATALADSSRKE